jgi:hypothetical protein
MVKSVSEPPIHVFYDGEYWRVDYGSYIDGFYITQAIATAKATEAAAREHRELQIDAAD